MNSDILSFKPIIQTNFIGGETNSAILTTPHIQGAIAALDILDARQYCQYSIKSPTELVISLHPGYDQYPQNCLVETITAVAAYWSCCEKLDRKQFWSTPPNLHSFRVGDYVCLGAGINIEVFKTLIHQLTVKEAVKMLRDQLEIVEKQIPSAKEARSRWEQAIKMIEQINILGKTSVEDWTCCMNFLSFLEKVSKDFSLLEKGMVSPLAQIKDLIREFEELATSTSTSTDIVNLWERLLNSLKRTAKDLETKGSQENICKDALSFIEEKCLEATAKNFQRTRLI